jgi:hypothetical protein
MSRHRFCLLLLCVSSLCLCNRVCAQSRLNIVEAAATVTTTATAEDTTPAPTAFLRPDSLRTRYHARLDAGYHTPRVHPYFRDEYRVIQDLRRLILFVDPYVLIGLEPMQELLGVVQLFPQDKQNEMIRVAVAGSVVNQVSETVSRRLRRTKLKFVQWQLEKVTMSRGFRRFYVSGAYGVNIKSFAVHVPRLKLTYSKQATKYYATEGFHFAPFKHVGFAYGWSGGEPTYGPRFNTPLGNAGLTYDERYDVMFASYEFRRGMSAIVRMLYVSYLKFPQANLWRAEVMLRR